MKQEQIVLEDLQGMDNRCVTPDQQIGPWKILAKASSDLGYLRRDTYQTIQEIPDYDFPTF